jgi:hypothetical protein
MRRGITIATGIAIAIAAVLATMVFTGSNQAPTVQEGNDFVATDWAMGQRERLSWTQDDKGRIKGTYWTEVLSDTGNTSGQWVRDADPRDIYGTQHGREIFIPGHCFDDHTPGTCSYDGKVELLNGTITGDHLKLSQHLGVQTTTDLTRFKGDSPSRGAP